MCAVTSATRRVTTIYCKAKDREGRGEVSAGLEISEGIKRSDSSNDPIRAEGRVFLRFFATDRSKEQHIRTMLEPWEAFQLSRLIQQAVESREKVELRLAPHRFTRDGEDIVTRCSWKNGSGRVGRGMRSRRCARVAATTSR